MQGRVDALTKDLIGKWEPVMSDFTHIRNFS